MTPNKVCPVLIRKKDDDRQILAFRHPFAGDQLIKGTIEENESPKVAALRELAEESGIGSAKIVRDLGVWETGFENQVWAFFLCEAENLSDKWTFHANDDGGLDFAFFWHSLKSEPDEFHPLYQNAMRWLKDKLSII